MLWAVSCCWDKNKPCSQLAPPIFTQAKSQDSTHTHCRGREQLKQYFIFIEFFLSRLSLHLAVASLRDTERQTCNSAFDCDRSAFTERLKSGNTCARINWEWLEVCRTNQHEWSHYRSDWEHFFHVKTTKCFHEDIPPHLLKSPKKQRKVNSVACRIKTSK